MFQMPKFMRGLTVAIFICITLCARANNFVINLPSPIENEDYSDQVKSFFTDVYIKLNIAPSFVFFSAERGFSLLEQNQIQAEGYRASYIGDLQGQPYKIDTPLATVKVGVFCAVKESCIIRPNRTYAIQTGFSLGKVICNLLDIQCKYERTPKGIAKLLDMGMVDAVITPYPAYSKYLCLSKLDTFYFHRLSEFNFSIYHYTNISDVQLRNVLENSLVENVQKYSSLFVRYHENPSLEHCDKMLFDVAPPH